MKLRKLALCVATCTLIAAAQDHRSFCLFFDLNSMTEESLGQAQEKAVRFIEQSVGSSDRVAVMTFASDLKVAQDFTSDRAALVAAVRRLGLAPGLAAPREAVDRRLQALEKASKILAAIPDKKLLLYFADGAVRRSAASQDQLKATIDAAVHANVAIFPM